MVRCSEDANKNIQITCYSPWVKGSTIRPCSFTQILDRHIVADTSPKPARMYSSLSAISAASVYNVQNAAALCGRLDATVPQLGQYSFTRVYRTAILFLSGRSGRCEQLYNVTRDNCAYPVSRDSVKKCYVTLWSWLAPSASTTKEQYGGPVYPCETILIYLSYTLPFFGRSLFGLGIFFMITVQLHATIVPGFKLLPREFQSSTRKQNRFPIQYEKIEQINSEKKLKFIRTHEKN